ncbi:tripartite tricarboxylate transporter TctB family protein [Thermodesulfobacteriota bacterium]
MVLKVLRITFTIMVMTFIAVLVVIAFGYDRKSALLPLIVGISSLLLGGLVLATEISPKLNNLFMTNLFQIGNGRKGTDSRLSALHFGLTSFWILLLLLLLFFFGFLVSLPVWIFCYIFFQGHKPWLNSFIISVIIWLFLYGFFVLIMKLDLYKGILFEGIF